MKQLEKSNSIRDALVLDEGTADIFMSYGMHCVGCPSSSGETIEHAAVKHGVEPDAMLKKLNDYLKTKN